MESDRSIRNASMALDEHLTLIRTDIAAWFDLFADDAVVEFPYASSLGLFSSLEGIEAIRRYFADTPERFRELSFAGLRRYVTTDPDVVLAEFHGSALIGSTGLRYEQDYIAVLKTREGKIVLYREFWDPQRVLEAFGGEENLRRAVVGS